MDGAPFDPPELERRHGLGFYATRTEGVPGRLKQHADDFVVRELSSYPRPDPEGPFTVLRVRSSGWEQHELAERLAQRLHLSSHAISWAGTKDRRAHSERLLSYRGAPPEGAIELRDVEILEAYRARDGLGLGHHYGNLFEIRVEVDGSLGDSGEARAQATRSALIELGGFANFFGLQRFGEVRPVTHEVGRALVLGDPARAVETYLTWLPPEGEVLGADARRSYAEHHDSARALSEFPREFRFERALLAELARGREPARALHALSRELRLLFVHAYQAWLFNRWLSERWRRGLSLTRPSAGDFVLRQLKDGTLSAHDAVPVTDDNRPECIDLVERGRGRLAGPLVGYDTPVSDGPGGEILEELLREEGVQRSDFRLPRTPEISSAGAHRSAWVPLPPVSLRAAPAVESAVAGLSLAFALPKGCYATVLLREFLKTGARRGASRADETQN